MKYLKNNTELNYTFFSNEILAGEYFAIPDVDLIKWTSSSAIMSAVTSLILVVARDDSGTTDYTVMLEGLNYLRNEVPTTVSVSALPQSPPFAESSHHTFKGTGYKQNCPQSATTNIDFTVDQSYDLTGIEILNGRLGDEVNMKVLDTATGTYSSVANYVLSQFGVNWNITPDRFSKVLSYSARLQVGMIVRFEYINNDISDRMIYANLDLHEIKA